VDTFADIPINDRPDPFVARKDKDALQVARHLSQQPA
jgi:hypothetical protein